MDITITPARLSGQVAAIPSKSQAHRLMICSAFADKPTTLVCPQTNRDMEATAACLNALGAKVTRTEAGYRIDPIKTVPGQAILPCGESGSTLRFLLPVVGALGVDGYFQMEGRLPDRPLSPLWELMIDSGCCLTRPDKATIRCTGKLKGTVFKIAGNVSSQYISGLLFAAALMCEPVQIQIEGILQSAPYAEMTRQVLRTFGVDTSNYLVQGKLPLHSPGNITVEGDWSNGAFFLAAKALGSPVSVTGLDESSTQGDRAVRQLLTALETNQRIDAANIPDLVPILAVVAGAKHGATFENIARLRLKESDRVASTQAMLRILGCETTATENTLQVYPACYQGGTVDACNDHRIAMAAAIAATVCKEPVTILGAQCTEKSYPGFWKDYRMLGGNYEQHIR